MVTLTIFPPSLPANANGTTLVGVYIVTFCSLPSQAFAVYFLYVGHTPQLEIGVIGL